ncbi:MAG: hypothetical protein H7Z40_21555 [Phycisphaerae bacterium]|nr:hypothetical protein [Gemmatimonadaceae bacterium]
MLRTAVGEFDSERWETTRHEVEASLAQLGQDREALIAEADDVRGLLTSARHRPAAPEPEPVPLVVVSTESMEQELVSSNVAAAIAHADPAVAEHAIDLNAAGEITPHRTPAHDVSAQLITTDPYLRAVNARAAQSDSDIESAFAVSDPEFADLTGARETNMHGLGATTQHDVSVENERDTEANAAIDALGAPASSHQNDALDNIDVFGEPRATPRAGAPDVLPPRSINDPYAPRASAPNPETPKSATPQPPTGGARDGFDDLAFLRSITDSASGATSAGSGTTRTGGSTDQAKTLRCTECGTLNFPTEWYCERCGGELAAF